MHNRKSYLTNIGRVCGYVCLLVAGSLFISCSNSKKAGQNLSPEIEQKVATAGNLINAGISDVVDLSSSPVVIGGIGEILVSNADGCNVTIFEISGVQSARFDGREAMSISMPQGIYIVKVDDMAFKIYVK